MTPVFPHFKPLTIKDMEMVREACRSYHPVTSELNFTNFYMWRGYYGFEWSMLGDWLLMLATSAKEGYTFFPPIGPPGRKQAVKTLLEWLREEKQEITPRIKRADERLVDELAGSPEFRIEEARDHFDYLYRREDLDLLNGRKYHAKRNHINKFRRLFHLEYRPIDENEVEACLKLMAKWCEYHRCSEEYDLEAECEAVHSVMLNWRQLGVRGGVMFIEGNAAAFTVGEEISPDTAVVHIEKADPEIPQLYTMISQQFCHHAWQHVTYINREQDLGKPGLRKAKLSYYPVELIKKFTITTA